MSCRCRCRYVASLSTKWVCCQIESGPKLYHIFLNLTMYVLLQHRQVKFSSRDGDLLSLRYRCWITDKVETPVCYHMHYCVRRSQSTILVKVVTHGRRRRIPTRRCQANKHCSWCISLYSVLLGGYDRPHCPLLSILHEQSRDRMSRHFLSKLS